MNTNSTLPDFPTVILFNNFANYFIDKMDKIYVKLTINKTKLINLTTKKYMSTNAVLSIFDLPTITEMYNQVTT